MPEEKKKKPATKEELLRQVVSDGNAQALKPTAGSKLKRLFFGGDAKEAGRYVVQNTILPAIRTMLFESGQRGLERMIYGDQYDHIGRAPMQQQHWSGGRYTYNQPVHSTRHPAMLPGQPPHQAPSSRPSRMGEVEISSKEEAYGALEMMYDLIENFQVASVADLNQILGWVSAHTDHSWGWYDLSGATIQQIKNGWLLRLPQPQPISN